MLSWEEKRVVQRDWTVKWENKQYQLDRRHEGLSLVGKTITVRLLRDESRQMVYQGKKLKWKELSAKEAPSPGSQPPVATGRQSQGTKSMSRKETEEGRGRQRA